MMIMIIFYAVLNTYVNIINAKITNTNLNTQNDAILCKR